LELISHRQLLLFHILFEIKQYNDPLERFMVVVKWFLGLLRSETMEKKPFNPVYGETHISWVANDEKDQPENITEFIAEQVSHHPPVSAFFVRNKTENITIQGATCFGVKLSMNSATVTTCGPVTITTETETYNISKCVPDLSICNTVMPGKKYIIWNGEVKISCPESGYEASIITEERYGRVNGIKGTIYHQDEPNKHIYRFEGVCGQKTNYWQVGKEKEKDILIDHSALEESYIDYLPRNLRTEFDSLRLWVPVVEEIIKDDMEQADLEKKKIEAAQRVRSAEKKTAKKLDEGIYFKRESGSDIWQFRNNVSVQEIINGHGASNPSNSEPEQSVADGMPPPEKSPVNDNSDISPQVSKELNESGEHK